MKPPNAPGLLPTAPCATRAWRAGVAGALLLLSFVGWCAEPDWQWGVYAGQHYDTEPAGIIKGKASFQNQYIVAVTASRTLWRSESLPLALEVDGMAGHQFGVATLQEFAVAPVLRWSGFPWNGTLPTAVRFGPLGVSYTTDISPLERGVNDQGSRWLNFLVIEAAFTRPQAKSPEFFVRLHHRCTVYDLINNYGANGEDFLAIGLRRRF